MHLLMFPPRGRQGDTRGDTVENLVGFPTHKQIFGVQNSSGAIIFVMKPHLELPEKGSNVPTACLGVLSDSFGL